MDDKIFYPSPMGLIELEGTEANGLSGIGFVRQKNKTQKSRLPDFLKAAKKELHEYLAGHRQQFSSRLNLQGTPFQEKVWQELLKIPYGQIVSYQKIATNIKHPRAVRAVANAIGKNPLPIFVPCHRVIYQSGGLGGFSCGVHRKRWLLSHEKKNA